MEPRFVKMGNGQIVNLNQINGVKYFSANERRSEKQAVEIYAGGTMFIVTGAAADRVWQILCEMALTIYAEDEDVQPDS